MRLGGILSLLSCVAVAAQSQQIAWPVKDDGYSEAVQWFEFVEKEAE